MFFGKGKWRCEPAGDIGALGKLSDTATGDTLSTRRIRLYMIPLKYPVYLSALQDKNKGDDDKVSGF